MVLSKPDLIKIIKTGDLKSPEIEAAVSEGMIGIEPDLDDNQLGEASLDLRLGFTFCKFNDNPGITVTIAKEIPQVDGLWDSVTLSESLGKMETCKLNPGEFILGMTYEKIYVPNNLIGFIEGRSSYARFGLSMHQSAPWIQPGYRGPITLEIFNNGNLSIELTPLLDRPCQLAFFPLSTPVSDKDKYGGKKGDVFQDHDHPLER